MSDNYTYPLGVEAIKDLIPHRDPFLLIDNILEVSGNTIKATTKLSPENPILVGHFPGNPVFPGVLMVEAMAQAAGCLGKITTGKLESCLLTKIENSRFRRIVVPGDTMVFSVTLVKQQASFFWFEGECHVDGKLAMSAKFSANFM